MVDENFGVQLLSTESGEHGGRSEPEEDTTDHGHRLSSIWLEKGLQVTCSPIRLYRSMDLQRHSVGLTAYSLATVEMRGFSVTLDPKRLDGGAPNQSC